MTKKLRAIVFDFDGVVLESGDVKTDAFVELFAEHGGEVQARVKAHHLANLGVSRFLKFEWVYQNVLRLPYSDELGKELGEKFSALVLDKVIASPYVPGAREALETLAPSYPQFVASGTPQNELDLIVEKRDLRRVFREVHGTPRDKPTILRDLLARHDHAAGEVLFVGDGMSDYKAAIEVGLPFLARDTPDMHDQWMKLGVPRSEDLRVLPDLVERWQ